MTKQQALQQARKLFGKRAAVSESAKGTRQVGYVECGFFNIIGDGDNWQTAVREAKGKAA